MKIQSGIDFWQKYLQCNAMGIGPDARNITCLLFHRSHQFFLFPCYLCGTALLPSAPVNCAKTTPPCSVAMLFFTIWNKLYSPIKCENVKSPRLAFSYRHLIKALTRTQFRRYQKCTSTWILSGITHIFDIRFPSHHLVAKLIATLILLSSYPRWFPLPHIPLHIFIYPQLWLAALWHYIVPSGFS